MIGAIFAIRKAVIQSPCDRDRRSAFFDRLDEVLDLGFESIHLRRMWIGNKSAHDRDALDDLGYALHEQKRKSDDDQSFGSPLRKPARVARLLVDFIGAPEERAAGDDHDDGQGQKKKQ